MSLPENWDQLDADEKFEARFVSYKAAEEINFVSEKIKEKYKNQVQMLKDVIELKEPARVPIVPLIGILPAKYGGITVEEAMYDYAKMGKAWKKFNRDFELDVLTSCGLVGSGNLLEILDFRLYTWPGHGTGPDTPYQCVEKEYMKADEYDLLITDPSRFWQTRYYPRIYGALEPWSKLSPITDQTGAAAAATMVPVGLPDVQESFEKYLAAGREALKWVQAVGKIDGEIKASQGVPSIFGGITIAPFDMLGDGLRGTREIMLDMYRRPDKLLAAMEAFIPILVDMGLRGANQSNCPIVFIPLHKGADSFMSREQFAEFYWPTLKKVILELIYEGCVPYVFVEGSYNKRLDFLADPDLPEGRIIWTFDKIDMVKAKKKLEGKACIGGDVSASLLKAGTTEDIRDYVRNLIDRVADGGGFVLSNSAAIDVAKTENLKAMIEAGKEFGVY